MARLGLAAHGDRLRDNGAVMNGSTTKLSCLSIHSKIGPEIRARPSGGQRRGEDKMAMATWDSIGGPWELALAFAMDSEMDDRQAREGCKEDDDDAAAAIPIAGGLRGGVEEGVWRSDCRQRNTIAAALTRRQQAGDKQRGTAEARNSGEEGSGERKTARIRGSSSTKF